MPAEEPSPRRSRTLLVSFLGGIVRRFGDWMPIGGAVTLMQELGVDESNVRTSVFRLKRKGWLEQERHGSVVGYRLTPLALDTLADGDQVVWHARVPADLEEGWCIVTFSVPESDRAKRHLLRSHLSSLGFGNVGGGVWIAPARMLAGAERAVRELELVGRAAVFVGRYAAGPDLEELVASAWALDDIESSYRNFIDAHREDGEWAASGRRDPARAFRTFVSAVDDWRKLPFRDPGLPRAVLATSWVAEDAGRLFETIVDRLDGDAIAYAGRQWPDDTAN